MTPKTQWQYSCHRCSQTVNVKARRRKGSLSRAHLRGWLAIPGVLILCPEHLGHMKDPRNPERKPNEKEKQMNQKMLTIDGVTYTRQADPAEAVKRIVVLQRGWVVVGEMRQNGAQITVDNASVIRIWGTTKGLGEIAADGPTKSTVLDPCGTVRAHELAVIMTLDCDPGKW